MLDTSASQNFVSERIAKKLDWNLRDSMIQIKAINLTVRNVVAYMKNFDMVWVIGAGNLTSLLLHLMNLLWFLVRM